MLAAFRTRRVLRLHSFHPLSSFAVTVLIGVVTTALNVLLIPENYVGIMSSL